jgi:flagellar motor switch protein FliN/FliY
MNESGKLTQDEMEALLGDSKQTLPKDAFRFAEFSEIDEYQYGADKVNLNLLLDIALDVVVELGRTHKKISEVLELTNGSVMELDKLAGEPVDIFVGNKLIAKGEVVVVDEHFGVRITEIISKPI